MKPTVILVDDHPLILRSMQAIIDADKRYQVIGTASNVEELFTAMQNQLPDILCLDISLPDIDGFEIFDRVKKLYPQQKIIIFTMHRIKRYMDHFKEHGAHGYVLKSGELGDLLEALDSVNSGQKYFPNDVVTQQSKDAPEERNQIQITELEHAVLHELNKANSNKQIAELLHLNIEQVIEIRKNLLFKTNTLNTRELLKYAKERRWLK